MTSSSNLMDYNVKLLGLLPLHYDFSKGEHYGIRFQTQKLKKIKKPSEDRHDGQVVISDENLLSSTAIAETKIIHTPVHTATTNLSNVNDDGVNTLASEVAQKLVVEVSRDDNAAECVVLREVPAHEEGKTLEPCVTKGDDKEIEKPEMETADDEPEVDKILKEENAAKFLYKCFNHTGNKRPDFLSYRLPIMHLAMSPHPYFFKVNKIRFKPYGCQEDMEFIQIKWPIQLDALYEKPNNGSSGWSGPKFNKWATEESNHETVSSHQESKPTACDGKNAEVAKARADDESDSDSDSDSPSTYHHAYLQAEINPKSGQSRNVDGFNNPTREFNILITALVGGVWKLEEDPSNYTCQHLAEMRTVKEETLHGKSQSIFYKRVRMLSNYWQCYLAGAKYYLVGVNGPIRNDQKEERREIKELRLYEVAKIPDFIKRSGAKEGFTPWTKEILENRLYKSLCVIYDKVIDAPVDTEFMFVKYNEFDPPVHDIDGRITGPYLLAFRQLIIEGLPTPLPPKLITNLMKAVKYGAAVEFFLEREFTREDFPETEEKENGLVLTFKIETLAHLFRSIVESYLKKHEKFPADSGMENLVIKKVTMKKPVAPGGNNAQPWRNDGQQRTNRWDNTQSWRNANDQQQRTNQWNDRQTWRDSNHHQRQAYPLNNDDGRREPSRQFFAPTRRSESDAGDMNSNWRRK